MSARIKKVIPKGIETYEEATGQVPMPGKTKRRCKLNLTMPESKGVESARI